MSQVELKFKVTQRMICYYGQYISVPCNTYAVVLDERGYIIYFINDNDVEPTISVWDEYSVWVTNLPKIRTHYQYVLPDGFDWKTTLRYLTPHIISYGEFHE